MDQFLDSWHSYRFRYCSVNNLGLFKKPSYYLISSAMDGNEKAIEKLLAFYDPYISKCCLRSLYDEYGNVYIVVDMELKGRIREALIKMILGFDIEDMDLEPEE